MCTENIAVIFFCSPPAVIVFCTIFFILCFVLLSLLIRVCFSFLHLFCLFLLPFLCVMPKFPRRRITAEQRSGQYRQNAAGQPLCSACDCVLEIRGRTRDLRSFVHQRTLFTHKWYTLLCPSCFTLAAKALEKDHPTCVSCFCEADVRYGTLALCSACAVKDNSQLVRWKSRTEE